MGIRETVSERIGVERVEIELRASGTWRHHRRHVEATLGVMLFIDITLSVYTALPLSATSVARHSVCQKASRKESVSVPYQYPINNFGNIIFTMKHFGNISTTSSSTLVTALSAL